LRPAFAYFTVAANFSTRQRILCFINRQYSTITKAAGKYFFALSINNFYFSRQAFNLKS
jgi:hypothetical protein